MTGKVKNLSRRLTSRLSNALSKIFKFKVLKKNNPKLFRNSRLRIRQDGYEILEFKVGKEWKVIYTRQGSEDPWILKDEFMVNNPMENEVSIAKEKYDQSVSKQVDEIAEVESPDGVPGVPEEVSDDVIRNVFYQIISDTSEVLESINIDWDRPDEILPTEVPPLPVETDIEELQSRLQTLESVNESLKRNFEKKEQELRNLQARSVNRDVLNEKEQEVNNALKKLKDVESERNKLLLRVNVSDELLSETSELVKKLTIENRNVKEKFTKFQKAAEREKEIELKEVRQRFKQELREYQTDREQAFQEYTQSVERIRAEYEEKIKVAESEKTKVNNKLVKAHEHIKWLQRAEHKQHSVPDIDLNEREVGGVFAGVMERIDSINDAINNLDPDDPDFEKLVNGNLEALRVEVQEYKLRAEKLTGHQKSAYETFKKFTERGIDKINLKLDRKVEGEETLKLLKEETNNDYRVKFERLKKWLKENGLEVSSVVISIGSLIAVLATALRKTVQNVARGAFSFGKAVVKVLSKLGPVFSALGNIILTALGILSKGLM